MKKMKKNYKTRLLITLLIMVLMLFGCGNTQAETTPAPVPEEKEPEVVAEVESTVEEVPTAEEESETTEETTEVEEQQETPTTPMVDWETFAAQADNDDICLVISNEKMATQTVLFGDANHKVPYPYIEGDKIAIPIRDSIQRICYNTVNMDGTPKGEDQEIYWKDSNNTSQKYIEFTIGDEVAYNILIFDENSKMISSFLISTVAAKN